MRGRRDGAVVRDAATGAATSASRTADDLQQRLHRLADAATLLRRHGVEPEEPDVEALVARAAARLRHGSDRTVVALVGSTGSGKSSLLNAVAGEQVARAGVTRPTTSVTQAVTFGDPADALLDQIGVTRRHHLAAGATTSTTATPLSGLVLLDLPDFDSVSASHRMEVDRLIQLVDLMLWVTDPQKYADDALHNGYLRPLSGHAEVMRVALNKADLLTPAQLRDCLADLSRLLEADGLDGSTPIPTSTVADGGTDALAQVLAEQVGARQAALARISADIDAAARGLSHAAGAPPSIDLDRLGRELADGLAHAAGIDAVSALVAAQHRRDAALTVGWPPVRVVRRIRRAPLAQLRTTVDSPVAQAEVSRTLRRTAAAVTSALDHGASEGVVARAADDDGRGAGGWAVAADAAVRDQVVAVSEALDTRTSRDVQVLRRPARWWRPVALLHRLLLLVAAAGGLWLIGLALAANLLLVDAADFTPHLGRVPVPTALLLGGLLLGLLTALVATAFARVGARRRAKAAAAALRDGADQVGQALVIDPLRTLLEDAHTVSELLHGARGDRLT